MITVNVKKAFPDVTINAEFSTTAGITVLFGTSGAGKSSIVNMVAGLINPDEGLITIEDTVVFDSSKNINLTPENRGTGYVFQESRLFPHMTVQKNLLYGTKGKPESRITLGQVCDLLGIEKLLTRYPKNLSGGEKQRVALGRALLSSPKLLLMDEPMASLDSARRDELIDYMAKTASTFQIPVIYVTHNIDELVRLASHIGLMKKGQLIKFGYAADVFNSYEMISLLPPKEAGMVLEGVVSNAEIGSGLKEVVFKGGSIEVAGAGLNTGDKVRFKVPAVDVLVSKQPPSTSARNIFKGIIKNINTDGYLANLLIDVDGTEMWAKITVKSANEMGLHTGSEVYATLKTVVASQTIYKLVA